MLSIIQAAGWPIWPLLACSVVALALVIERLFSLRRQLIAPDGLLEQAITASQKSLPSADVTTQLRDHSALGKVLASGWQTFFSVTLPNIKWGLLYGVLLCNARAMGEFGAVSVVSGHIKGETNTIPLHVEILYNEYNFVSAFAVASLLTLLALVTLVLKRIIEARTAHH